MTTPGAPLEDHAAAIRALLQERYASREVAYQASREAIRHAANAIRALHREEPDRAAALLEEAQATLARATDAVIPHPEVRYAGFVADAQKEVAEASLLTAFLAGTPPPGPADLAVDVGAWLNGLGEAASELRRVILDRLRRGRVQECEALLDQMDTAYGVLVTMDFPDSMTSGLRRTTDVLRGVLEKTRGDLTVALRDEALARRLDRVARDLGHAADGTPSP